MKCNVSIHQAMGTTLVSPENLANINCFFSDIDIKLDKTIPCIHDIEIINRPHIITQSIMRFKCTDEPTLLGEINKVSFHKSSGKTNMPTYILKM